MAALVGLGMLMTACGPIAFNDQVNFASASTPEPETAPEPEPVGHAKLEGDHIIIDDKIHFGYDSADIQEDSFELLDDVAKVMQDNPQIEQLDIIGHTSSEGSKKHNDELSAARAKAVEEYLVSHGISQDRLMSEGKGPSEPIADNDTEEGKEKNRRVEFKVTKMGEAGGDDKGPARARPSA